MKLRNVRRRQWERYITIQCRHPSREHIVASRGIERHYNREVRRRDRRR